MTKTIFIIPGFKHKPQDGNFDWMVEFFKSKNFIVKKFNSSWNHTVMSDYKLRFQKYYEENKTEHTTVLGFSYGAMTALITASTLKPDKLILCSLSPYFHEDLKKLKPWWKVYIGIRRAKDFDHYKAREIAKKITIPTVIMYGEKEAVKYPQLEQRCIETAEIIPNAKLVKVKNAPHKIYDENYVREIKKLFL